MSPQKQTQSDENSPATPVATPQRSQRDTPTWQNFPAAISFPQLSTLFTNENLTLTAYSLSEPMRENVSFHMETV